MGLKVLVQAELAPDLLTLLVDSPQEVVQKARVLVQIGKAADGAHLLIATTKAAGSDGLLGRVGHRSGSGLQRAGCGAAPAAPAGGSSGFEQWAM